MHRLSLRGDRCHRRWMGGITTGLSILLIACSAPPTVNPPSETNPAELEAPPSMSPIQPVVNNNLSQQLPISAQAIVGDQTIRLEVARTPQQQAMGLMYRSALPADRGMLFPFDPPRPVGFWMKNVPVPLDMVFLQGGIVKAIAANVPPCTTDPCPSYGPSGLVDQVIELRGGRAAELGLEVGEKVVIRFQSPKPSVSPEVP